MPVNEKPEVKQVSSNGERACRCRSRSSEGHPGLSHISTPIHAAHFYLRVQCRGEAFISISGALGAARLRSLRRRV